MSAAGTVRVPLFDATTARAPFTIIAGTLSAAGDALHRLPPRLARLWIWWDPISAAASAMPGKSARKSALE